MKHLFPFLFSLLLLCIPTLLKAQNSTTTDSVKLEISDTSGQVHTITLAWPYKGPPPVGSEKALERKLTTALASKGVACKPKRVKLPGGVWMCGDGTTIKTNDQRMIRLLDAAWSD